MDDERRLARARTFDQIAELYDRARPYYREEMFDDLFRLAGIAPASARILEIGCGTGHATGPLAQRGAEIIGVELGPNLARIAAEKLSAFPRVSVVTANFEAWESHGRQFDIVFAATAWLFSEMRRLIALRPGGRIAKHQLTLLHLARKNQPSAEPKGR